VAVGSTFINETCRIVSQSVSQSVSQREVNRDSWAHVRLCGDCTMNVQRQVQLCLDESIRDD
jgi:hypothetical protein